MRSTFTWALALVGTVSAANLHAANKANVKPTTTSAPSEDACGIVKAAAESLLPAAPTATAAFIKPSLAYSCLHSVPVDKERDLDLLNYLEPYLEFQSTLEQLSHPPEGYLIPGVDVLSGIGQIRAKLSKDQYKSQLDFALELKYLFFQASDGHFNYNPAIPSIFSFTSLNGIVSVADEVTGIPRVYLRSDFEKSVANDTDVYDIESIDGTPICEFIEAQASRLQTQDPDAKYNKMFTNPAQFARGSAAGFTVRLAGNCPDEEVIKFTNDTTYTNELYARVSRTTLEWLDTAEKLHNHFEVPATTTSAAASTTAPSTSTTVSSSIPSPTSLEGYPKPVAFHKHEWISGYFMEGKGYEDTAVLAVLGFSPWTISKPNGTFEIREAFRTVAEFLEKAKDAKKKKLIIDVQGNGGGFIAAGFQLYNQLFPKTTDIWDGNRIRATEALNAIGLTAQDSSPAILADFIGTLLDEDRKPYKDWEDIFGPEVVAGQNATKLLRYNQTELSYPKTKGDPLFAPEDIVIVTDGGCASTCTIFTGLMVREQGVRTIALGGRPMESAMQAVGGVEGAQVLQFSDLRQVIMQVGRDAVKNNNTKYLKEAFDVLPDIGEPPLLPPLATSGGFNYRNAYARKNAHGEPEHFRYEAANCRLFYTEKMIVDPVAVWTASYDATWNKGKCVARSTVNTDDTIGDGTVAYSAGVKSKASAYAGPGALSYKGAYEAPRPYVQKKKGSQKRSVEDADLSPPDDFEYEFKYRIGDIEEYFQDNVPEDWEYEQKLRVGFAQAVDF
ncbi:peptidase s41 family protein [Colletotrichum kahawae]|uniref:Peptidase s41 family protein n=1 Tax=Colletotrichum kahawae TaxID=34407 RepID=A0AAE0D9T2_COLKA|nr:peptidase s41 family protein [Colletotrichum kahawae]